ncbi:MAG: hypothetical protein D3926_04535 [Desulfobacteraceae bacterium]|nr:MAG: hypothetical protein D3926_04535 [Desulfobacteraceae bacterium]
MFTSNSTILNMVTGDPVAFGFEKRTLNAAILASALTCFFGCYMQTPECARPHHSPTVLRSSEILIEAGIVALTLFTVSYLAISTLHSERDKIAGLNHEMTRLNEHLKTRNAELESAMDEIRTLKGIVPICASCKKIRDDKGYWNFLEAYIEKHSHAQFSHGMCPECSDKFYGGEDWYKQLKNESTE